MKNKASRELNRVLCMCLSGLGDMMMFTPTLRVLKQERPHTRIEILIMFDAAKELLKNNPDISEIICIPFLNQTFWRSLCQVLTLRKRKYDAVIAAFPSNRAEYNLIQFLIGGIRIGHNYLNYDRLCLNFLKNRTINESGHKHVVEENLRLLSLLDIPVPSDYPPMQLSLTESDRDTAKQWVTKYALRGNRRFGFHPGSAIFKNHIRKRWSPENFGAVARHLVEKYQADILILGGPEEDDLKFQIVQASGRPDHVLPVCNVPLRTSLAILESCQLFIGNDAAFMHFSAALHIPTVAIFAYTDPLSLHPWCCPYRIVRHALPCSPCFFYSPKPAHCHAGLNYICINSIKTSEVILKIEELMSTSLV